MDMITEYDREQDDQNIVVARVRARVLQMIESKDES
jgi:hypothetical protein